MGLLERLLLADVLPCAVDDFFFLAITALERCVLISLLVIK